MQSPAAWSQIGFLLAYPFWYRALWLLRQPALEESRARASGGAGHRALDLRDALRDRGRDPLGASTPAAENVAQLLPSSSTCSCWPPSTTPCAAPP